MYIEQVNIKNYKSYSGEVSSGEFSPLHNVVVGKNGSGKSSFFNAILYCLDIESSSQDNGNGASGKQSKNSDLEPQGALLNQLVIGEVEVILANEDGRFPSGTSKVSIKRTFGTLDKKIYLNNKEITSAMLEQQFEVAGISKSNPYYVVKQGKITRLAMASQPDRLKLLKEVAGTLVYEEKRHDSIQMLRDIALKQGEVETKLTAINDRIQELKIERLYLKRTTLLNHLNKIFDFKTYTLNLNEIDIKLSDLDAQAINAARDGDVDVEGITVDDALERLKGLEIGLEHAIKQSEIKTDEIANNARHLSKIERELNELRTAHLMHQVQMEGIKELANITDQEARDLALKRTALLSKISQVKRNLDAIEPDLHETKRKNTMLLENIHFLSNSLNEQANSTTPFGSMDASIQDIPALERAVQEKNMSLQSLHANLADCKNEANRLFETKTKIQEEMDAADKLTSNLVAANNQLIERKSHLYNEKHKHEQDESVLTTDLEKAKQVNEKAEKAFFNSLSRDDKNGLRFIQDLMRKNEISGIYGPLINLFTVEDALFNAVESAIGNTLFHVVVDTDDTAKHVLNLYNNLNAETLTANESHQGTHMRSKKHSLPSSTVGIGSGRITFIPLNQISSDLKPIQYPKEKNTNPLIHRLVFDPKFDSLFQFVFGKKVLVRSLDIVNSLKNPPYPVSSNIDYITVDGESVSHKGSIVGGYKEKSSSRMFLYKEYEKSTQRIFQLQSNLDEILNKISMLQQSIFELSTEQVLTQSKIEDLSQKKDQDLIMQLLLLSSKEKILEYDINLLEQDRIPEIEQEMLGLNTRIKLLTNGDFKNLNASSNDQAHENASKKLALLQQEEKNLKGHLFELEQAKAANLNELNENLMKQLKDIDMKLTYKDGNSSYSTQGVPKESLDLQRKLSDKEKIFEKVKAKEASFAAEKEELEKYIENMNEQIAYLSVICKKDMGVLTKHAAQTNERSALQTAKTDFLAKISTLGGIPREAHLSALTIHDLNIECVGEDSTSSDNSDNDYDVDGEANDIFFNDENERATANQENLRPTRNSVTASTKTPTESVPNKGTRAAGGAQTTKQATSMHLQSLKKSNNEFSAAIQTILTAVDFADIISITQARQNVDKAFKRTQNMIKTNSGLLKMHKNITTASSKADTQYRNFISLRQSLNSRNKELKTTRSKIIELILKLDEEKTTTFRDFFRNVDKSFRDIFKKITQNTCGKGRLVLVKKSQQAAMFDDQELAADTGSSHTMTGASKRSQSKLARANSDTTNHSNRFQSERGLHSKLLSDLVLLNKDENDPYIGIGIEVIFNNLASSNKDPATQSSYRSNNHNDGTTISHEAADNEHDDNFDSEFEDEIDAKLAAINKKRKSKYINVRQLSGGQKTIVALCLIFAIQTVDPAPFYLFDEIDSALDQEYRSTVSDLISELKHPNSLQKNDHSRKPDHLPKLQDLNLQGDVGLTDDRMEDGDDDADLAGLSEDDENSTAKTLKLAQPPHSGNTQFITTTFSLEFLKNADAFFEVTMQGRSSTVSKASRLQAESVIRPTPPGLIDDADDA